MIHKIQTVVPTTLTKTNFSSKNIRNSNMHTQEVPITEKNCLTGIPSSYITFRGTEKCNFTYTDDANELIKRAEEYAKQLGHKEITPYHIIKVAIDDTEKKLSLLDNETLRSGIIESVSPITSIANLYAKRNMLQTDEDRETFLQYLEILKENNQEYIENSEFKPYDGGKVQLSTDITNTISKMLESISKNEETTAINAYSLIVSAFNALSFKEIPFASEFIKNLSSYSLYLSNNEIADNYIKLYDKRAIDVWNRLALGSNLFVTSEYSQEADRISASIIKTVDANKHGNFNSENTYIYAFSKDADIDEITNEIMTLKETLPDKNKVLLIDMNQLLLNSVRANENDGTQEIKPGLLTLGTLSDDKTKFILFLDKELYHTQIKNSIISSTYKDFLQFNVPPIHTYEVHEILKNNKKLTQAVKTPFSKEAKEKAVLYADKINGIFPDKAIDFMKRIAEYYSTEKKRINVKDVDEFAQIAHDLFNKNDDKSSFIIYDTGKTLANYYGKETTKKDIEAIIRQIKTGRIGTQGMIIYSKDGEAGSGRKYTAQVIAGEAKVPFLEINTSDFATSSEDDSDRKITPAQSMINWFREIKSAANENEYRTAILYINNFEEFAFSGPYLPGYKQAMTQLIREMAKAESEDVNILVIGSTDEYYVNAIPTVTRGFSQTIAVDTPAYNKQARKEIILNRIIDKKLPLNGRTKADKEQLINKLVKLTAYMSFVEIKDLINKTEQIMYERNKKKASIGDFIEAYLQLSTGRTSHPTMTDYNKRATTSHECGHATNLEVMSQLYKDRGEPWHQAQEVNFITLDPRGNFLGAVFEGQSENQDYPFEALFAGLVCSYGGYSCEKLFFNMDGSAGISQDLAQATNAAKRGVEYFGFGNNTGKISGAANIKSGEFHENVFKDMDVILTNAKIASDLITEGYKKFNEWFTDKYSKLIGTDECMVDGDDFRKMLLSWKKSQPKSVKEDLKILEDMLLDIIKSSKEGKKYYQLKHVL